MRLLRDVKKRAARLLISDQQAAGLQSHQSVKVSHPIEH